MLPTPTTTHVSFTHIYEPSEDSYLLLDTLSSPSERSFLTTHFPPTSTPAPLILELGTGSGVILAFVLAHARTIFARPDIALLGTDLNPFACVATAATARIARAENPSTAGTYLDAVRADLTNPFRPGIVDVLIFNPPYVPTASLPSPEWTPSTTTSDSQETFDRDSHLLSLSYAGGENGMETTSRLLDQIPEVLSPRGVAYILLCAQNRPENVMAEVRSWPGQDWRAEKVSTSGKTAGWEKLCVVRIWRVSTASSTEIA